MDDSLALPVGALGLRSYAKINLHLEVRRQRPDGYHEIETVLQSVDLYDTLHLVPRPSGLTLLVDDPAVTSGADNLVLRAAHALLESAGLTEAPRGVRLDLYKRIPSAAGFGGGSSNAAAALIGLNRFWRLGLSDVDLQTLGSRLGSDVPFFVRGGTCLARGRGEQLEALPAIPPTLFLLVFPGISIRAAWAYEQLRMGLTRRSTTLSMDQLKSILTRYPRAASGFYNRLEDAVCPAYPQIAEISSRLLQSGASVAMVSGSGSGIFAAFESRKVAEKARQSLARSDWRMPIVTSVGKGVELFS